MVEYLPRSAWKARPPKPGPGPLTPSRVLGVVVHWPGTTSHTPIHSLAAVASALRGWQTFHMDDKGWSDIAYQVAVDQEGRAWTLRGFGEQSGANGNNEVNEEYGAILLILVQGEEPSAAMKATVRGVIADFRRIFPRGVAIRPHSAVRPDGTDCPGPRASAALKRGEFNPGNEDDDDMAMSPQQWAELKVFIETTVQAYSDRNATNTRQQLAALVVTLQAMVDQLKAQVTNYSKSLDAVNDAAAAQVDADNDAAIAKVQAAVDELRALVESLTEPDPQTATK